MNDATLITSGARPAVRLERHLADPPSVVWLAITEREQLRTWFPCDVIVTGGRWVVGAELTFSFPPEIIEMTLAGKVLVVDEPRHLSFSWGEEILSFELSPEEDGTRFVLTDELPPDIAARSATGWETCLDRLAGQIPDSGAWQPRFEAYVASFEPTLGQQVGPPAEYKGEQHGE